MIYQDIYEEAVRWINKEIELAEKMGSSECLAEGYMSLIKIYVREGMNKEAREIMKKMVKMMSDIRDGDLIGKIKHVSGVFYKHMGEYKKAIKCWESAISEFKKIGDKVNMAKSLFALGELQIETGEEEEGMKNVKKACKEFSKRDMNYWITKCENIYVDLS